MTKLKAGKYFIGDPCYVLGHIWNEVCGIIIDKQVCLEGAFNLNDENHTRIAVFNTQYGDGSFPDDKGNFYAVDAGCIGAVPIEAIDPEVIAEYGEPQLGAYKDGLGQIVDFEASFEAKTEVNRRAYDGDGTLVFGHIRIDTNPRDEDEED